MGVKFENTDEKQAQTGKFTKGKSGNPKGRPKGARNKATIAAEALMDGDASAITKKAIELAKAGDLTAIKLCLERILPPRKSRPLQVSVPKIEKTEDVLKAVNAVLLALSNGKVNIEEAEALLRTVEVARKAMETEEMQREIDEIEQRLEALGG